MPNKFTDTRCVYCLRFFKELTSDHVFPKSWYPNTTPENIEKMQVPACDECNQKFSKLENGLLLKFGLTLNPKEAKSLGISDKVLRSLRASCAKDEVDQTHRERRFEKVIREIVTPDRIQKQSVLPSFGPSPDVDPNEQVGITVSDEELKLLGEKFARGITYDKYARYIDSDHSVDVFFVPDEFVDILERFGKQYSYGPGIRIRLMRFAFDVNQSCLFEIELWGKIRMYVSVLPRDESDYC